jgi:hypothetical protein
MFTEKKYVCGNQWLIDTEYPDYKDFLPFLNIEDKYEYSRETTAFGARQFPLWTDQDLAMVYKSKEHRDFTPLDGWDKVLEKTVAWTQDKE